MIRRVIILSIALLLSWSGNLDARLISFFPSDLQFPLTMVGDTAWDEVRFRYTGNDVGAVQVGISTTSDIPADSVFTMMMPEAVAPHCWLDSICVAAVRYRDAYGEDPASVQVMIDAGLLNLSSSIRRQWDFSLIGQDPVIAVHGISTNQMAFGAGWIILLWMESGAHSGWGKTYGLWPMTFHSVYTLPVCFAPIKGKLRSDTIHFTVSQGETDLEVFDVLVTGEGVLTVESCAPAPPAAFELGIPYPNPFNSIVILNYTLHTPSDIVLTIMDVSGREVERLRNGLISSGEHWETWDGSGAPAGDYIIILQSGNTALTRHITLLK